MNHRCNQQSAISNQRTGGKLCADGWLLMAGCCILLPGCITTQSQMVVIVPVADLRAQPHTTLNAGAHDPLQETQLICGERVHVLKRERGWAYVEAVEQREFTHANRWQGYPGWVPLTALSPAERLALPTAVVSIPWAATWTDAYRTTASSSLPMGTHLRATDIAGQLWKVELPDGRTVWMTHEDVGSLTELHALPALEKRRLILEHATRLLGTRYVWGGRSPQRTRPEDAVTGVDCSGLVNLAYRSVGIEIPRDAHEQFLRATRVKALQPADLIFLSERANPDHIVHVMLYAGEGMVIEGPGTGAAVRRLAITARLGRTLDWLEPGAVVEEQTVQFGSYLP